MSGHPDVTRPSPHSDIILVVEGAKIYANKHFLASHSPFFETLFFGDFIEKGKGEVELEDVPFQHMLCFIQVLCRAGRSIDDSNVEIMLQLADRFQAKAVVEECVRYLLTFTSTTYKGPELIRLGDLYRLDTLMERIIGLIDERDIRAAQQSAFFPSLSAHTKDCIIARLLTLIEDHECNPPNASPSY